MALIKICFHKGFQGDYWTITHLVQSKLNNKIRVTLSLFKDKYFYNSIKNDPNFMDYSLESREVIIEGFDIPRSEIYKLIQVSNKNVSFKLNPNFDSEDPESTEKLEVITELNFFADSENDI